MINFFFKIVSTTKESELSIASGTMALGYFVKLKEVVRERDGNKQEGGEQPS